MKREDIKGYDFSKDILPPKYVMEHLKAHDSEMHDDQPYMALAKASYTTKFWRYIQGQEDLNAAYEMSRLDQVEVNKLKPAISGYLANLYPRRLKVVIGPSPYTTGDPKKAEMLVNDWLNQPVMRNRVLSCARQALLYKGAGAKVGYDPAEEGLERVWMRTFPYWEMVLDTNVHDVDDARFIGHVSYKPKQEIIEQYGLEDDLSGTSRNDYLGSYLAGTKRAEYSDEGATSDNDAFVRVLEFCNLVDDFYDIDGTKYKGRLEIYICDESYGGDIKPVYMGPLPLVDAAGKALPHIVPLMFEHEPEYPFRGIAYAEQLLPQQKEINTMRSYMAQSARRDARIYVTAKGALDADAFTDLKSGEDGLIIEVDEQFAGNLSNIVVPIRHGPISANIQNVAQQAEIDFAQNTTISPAALGQITKASATEVMAVEGHTQSEFGRHAEQRDLFLIELVKRCLAAHTAAMYDPGDSEGAEQNLDNEGNELDKESLEVKREIEGIEEADEGSDFTPHMMYDPETGKSEKAETYERHVELEEQGWSHDKPQLEEVEDENEVDPDDAESLEIIDLASEAEPVRERKEVGRTNLRKVVLIGKDGEPVEIDIGDIDSSFDIGFSEAGRSPASQMEMRNNILALSDKMMQLMQVAEEQKNSVGIMAEQLLKTIHDQFEFPSNLSYDYIQNLKNEMEAEQPPEQAPAQPAQPAGEQEDPAQVLAQIEQMPPEQALQALEQILQGSPEALELVQQAKSLPPEEQAEAVRAIIQAIKENL